MKKTHLDTILHLLHICDFNVIAYIYIKYRQ